MERKFKKGSLYSYKANSSLAFIFIIKEVWDIAKQEYRVHYVRAYNHSKEDTRGKFLSYSETSSAALYKTVTNNHTEVLTKTEFPLLIKLIRKLIKKSSENHSILNPTNHTINYTFNFTFLSDVRKYNLNSFILFLEHQENHLRLLIVNPFSEDAVNFNPPNMQMKLIEIDLEVSENNEISVNYVSERPLTLWDFIRQYPDAIRLNENNKVVTRLAMLWDAITL